MDKWIVNISETDSEIWISELECDTREEAIKEGMKLAKEEGLKSFRIGEEENVVPTINVEQLFENISDDIYEEVGETAEDYLMYVKKEDVKKLSESLNEVFTKWLKETSNEPNFYKVVNCETIGVPQELTTKNIADYLFGEE